MAIVVSLTKARIEELMANWEEVALSQDEINALVGQLLVDYGSQQATLVNFSEVVLPDLEAALAGNSIAVSTLNDYIPALEAEVHTNADDIETLNVTTIPLLLSEIGSANNWIIQLNDVTLPELQAQIADAEGHFPITGPDIAANAIEANHILAHTITALQIAADTITANEIAADTITANEIAADAITANEIAAGAVTASEIAAGAVTAVKIQAGAITAEKLTVASLGYNVLLNGSFEEAATADATLPAQWVRGGYAAGSAVGGALDATQFASGTKSYRLDVTDAVEANSESLASVPLTPVAEGQVWYLAARVKGSVAFPGGFCLRFLDQNGSEIIGSVTIENQPVTTDWTEITGTISIPAGMSGMRAFALMYRPTAGATGSVYIDDFITNRVENISIYAQQTANKVGMVEAIANNALEAASMAQIGVDLLIQAQNEAYLLATQARGLVTTSTIAPTTDDAAGKINGSLWIQRAEDSGVTTAIYELTDGDWTLFSWGIGSVGGTEGSNITGTVPGGQLGAGTVDPTKLQTLYGEAVEAIAIGDLMNVYNDLGEPKVRKASATNGYEATAFSRSTYAVGDTVAICTDGYVEGKTGMAIGPLYLGDAGQVSSAPPAVAAGGIIQRVGTAVTDTQMIFQPMHKTTMT